MEDKQLIVVLGPTAVGKTALSIRLAQHFQTEIVSADSRQLYSGLDIGVARPSVAELESVPHHLVGFQPLGELFSAGRFEKIALDTLSELYKKFDRVICTGGSAMYIDALTHGLDELPSDERIQDELNSIQREKGMGVLVEELKLLDPVYAGQVDLANPHRVIRAIEICRITGKKYSDLRTGKDSRRNFSVVKIGLYAPRERLYERIHRRVDRMMEMGLEQEARALYPLRHLASLNTVGYKELFDCFDGTISLTRAVELIKQHSRNYAKRQMTWWRKDSTISWFDVTGENDILPAVIHEISKSR